MTVPVFLLVVTMAVCPSAEGRSLPKATDRLSALTHPILSTPQGCLPPQTPVQGDTEEGQDWVEAPQLWLVWFSGSPISLPSV